MEKMSEAEVKIFLLDQPRTGKLATVRADGRPHLAPIWFDLDGEQLIFTTWHESVKAANLQRTGQAALCVDEAAPPFAYVIIEGTVTISTDLAELRQWATRIAGRYMGPAQAEAFGRRNGVEGELLVRLTPTKTIAHKNISD